MSSFVESNDFFRVKEKDYDWVIAKYNMTDQMVKESIENVHQWYKMQFHLPKGAISDTRLFRLLLATGFSLEKTKQKIDNTFTARNMFPDLMGDRDPWSERLKAVTKYGKGAILPKRHDMCRVLILTFTCDDLTNYNIWDVIKYGLMAYDYRLSSDVSLGEHYIMDFKDIKLGHVSQTTPALLKQLLFILMECFGSKIKGIHFLNVPTFAKFTVTVLRVTLSNKLASRLHVHKDYESLHKIIPKSILPSDLGGDGKSSAELSDDLYGQLAKPEMRQWFLKQDQYKSDECKRIGATSHMFNDLLGFQGSFRTLNID